MVFRKTNPKTALFLSVILALHFSAAAQEEVNRPAMLYNWFEARNPTTHLDTTPIETLIRTARQYVNTQSDSAILLSKEIIRLSQLANYPDGAAKGLMNLGLVYVHREEIEIAKQIFREAGYYCRNAIFDREALMIEWEHNVSLPYLYNGETEIALTHLLQAKIKAISLNDTNQLISIHHTIGTLWLVNFDFENALSNLQHAIELSYSFNHNRLPALYNSFASFYGIKNDTSNLYVYAQKALESSIQQNNTTNQRRAFGHLGNYYMKTNQFRKALNAFKNSLQLSDTTNPSSAFSAYWGISESYYWLKNYEQADYFSKMALNSMPEKNRQTIVMVSFYNYLADLNFDKGNYKQAFQYKKTYSELNDSVKNIERDKALSKLEIRSNLAEKDKELTQKQLLLTRQQANLKNQKMWMIILSVSIILLSLLFFNFLRNARRRMHIFKQQEEINKLKAMVKGEEKERNRVTRELHDGIGGLLSAAAINLNTLGDKHKELSEDPIYQKTEMIIGEISNEIKKTANNLMPDVLLKHKLSDAIRLFCSYVQKGKNLDIKVMTSGSFDQLEEDFMLSIYRIVQELVHNTIKHAHASMAFVQLRADDKLISITVEDDGVGYDQNNMGTGMGLKNIHDRVRALQGQISIETDKDKGTSVYIEFDLEKI